MMASLAFLLFPFDVSDYDAAVCCRFVCFCRCRCLLFVGAAIVRRQRQTKLKWSLKTF
jgi:hypothetical protein